MTVTIRSIAAPTHADATTAVAVCDLIVRGVLIPHAALVATGRGELRIAAPDTRNRRIACTLIVDPDLHREAVAAVLSAARAIGLDPAPALAEARRRAQARAERLAMAAE